MSGRRVVHDELDLAQIFISERRQVNARGQELADEGSYADDANSLRAGPLLLSRRHLHFRGLSRDQAERQHLMLDVLGLAGAAPANLINQ